MKNNIAYFKTIKAEEAYKQAVEKINILINLES